MIDHGVINASNLWTFLRHRSGNEAGGREGGRPSVSEDNFSFFHSLLLCLAGGSTDSSNHHRQRGGAGGHLGAVERNSGGGGKSRFMNRLKSGSRNVDLGFDDEEDDDVREDDEGGFESRRFRG